MRQGKSSGFVGSLTRPYGGGANDPVRLVARLAAVLSIAAGVIHLSAAGDHTDMPRMFTGFVVVAVLQIGLGALLMWRRPSRLLLAGAVALMLGAIGAWLLSRTSGLPLVEGGHEEPIGFKDGVTVLFEIASIPLLLLLLSSELSRVALPSPRLATQTLTVLGAGILALMTPAMLLGGGDHTADRAGGPHGHDQTASAGTDPAHVGGGAGHDGERSSRHAAKAERPHRGRRHRRAKSPSGGGHGHQDVELASFPTAGGHGHGEPAQPPAGGHGDANGDRHRGGSRGKHRDRRHRDDRHEGDGRHGDGHGGHGDEEQPDPPEGPLDGIVSDVMELVPGSSGRG